MVKSRFLYVSFFILLFSFFFFSCAGSPSARTPPLWVTDTAKAYPNSEWLCFVEHDVSVRAAETAAVTRLAQYFRIDINSVTTANRQLAQDVGNIRGRSTLALQDSMDISQELVSTSLVEGLIGLQLESWTNPRDGRSYAIAFMNRRECSARYSAMISESEKTISSLTEEARRNPGTFEALQMLNLAHSFAQVVDNMHSLLTVLDPAAISTRPSYGSAQAVRTMAQSAARDIIITVNVTGDADGRIAKAFTEVLNARFFRTDAGSFAPSTAGNAPYFLDVSFMLENADIAGAQNVFVRYVLNYSLKNSAGAEVLSYSENAREGHLTQSEAEQRALRAAERSISGEGFAGIFDSFLESLL